MTHRLRRPTVALVALLATSALVGCSSDDTEEPTTGASPTAGPAPTSASSPPSPAPADPVQVEFTDPGVLSIGCNDFVVFVQFDRFTVDRAIELTGITAAESDDARLDRVWISDDPEQLATGSLSTEANGPQVTEEPGWDDKQPLEGYQLEPGTEYTVFARIFLPEYASSVGERVLGYREADGTEGSATWPASMTRASRCR